MLKVTLTIGLPGSGKTTWAKEQEEHQEQCIRINNDDIRELLFPKEHVWNPKDEKAVKARRQELVSIGLKQGYNIILDNTYLNPKTLASTKEWIRQQFPTVVIEEKDFRDVPVHVCIDRDMARAKRGERSVGAAVILKMAREAGLEDLKVENPWDPNLPTCIISDLDGTLALFGNRRNPYDASKCDIIDEVNKPIQDIIQTYWNLASSPSLKLIAEPRVSKVFFFSGRTDLWVDATKRFLANKARFDVDIQNQFFKLVMRQEGDRRPDEIVKREMYDANIAGQYNVHTVFDDRLKVIKMWKNLGLPVMNVGDCVDF